MFSYVWHTFFFDPVYNILVFFIDVVPGGDVGIAIVLATVLVKTVLLPLSLQAARTQLAMRQIEPKLRELKERYSKKEDREALAREMMATYREAGINPLASILLLIIQIPIIIALYFSISYGGGVPLPEINTALLYSFIPAPETVSMIFFGAVDIAAKSLPLALLAGVMQFIHGWLAMPSRPRPQPKSDGSAPDFSETLSHSMQIQMRYVMPVIIAVVSYTLSAAIALYFTVSSVMAIAQEYVVRRQGLKSDQ